VRWPVLPGVYGEGLLLEPTKGEPKACVVAIPDADQTPEMIVGLAPGLSKESQFARILAEQGHRVVIPTLVNREDTYSGSANVGRFTNQTHREFIYRMAYQMGRHIIGYEVQKVLAAVDWFTQTKDHPPVGVYGYGEGGLLAFEVKNSQRIRPEDLTGLMEFGKDYPESRRVLLYRGVDRLLKGEILCLPVDEFLKKLRPGLPLDALL